jgi:hypothetical protein
MFRRTALALATVLVLGREALAEDSQGSAPPAADSTVAPTDSRVAAALDLLQAQNTKANMEAMFDAVVAAAFNSAQRSHPNTSGDVLKQLQIAIREEVESSVDELLTLQAHEYAQHFSEEELRQLAAFYRSDLGKKYVSELPVIAKEMAPIGAEWGRNIAQKAIGRAMERLKKQGVQL